MNISKIDIGWFAATAAAAFVVVAGVSTYFYNNPLPARFDSASIDVASEQWALIEQPDMPFQDFRADQGVAVTKTIGKSPVSLSVDPVFDFYQWQWAPTLSVVHRDNVASVAGPEKVLHWIQLTAVKIDWDNKQLNRTHHRLEWYFNKGDTKPPPDVPDDPGDPEDPKDPPGEYKQLEKLSSDLARAMKDEKTAKALAEAYINGLLAGGNLSQLVANVRRSRETALLNRSDRTKDWEKGFVAPIDKELIKLAPTTVQKFTDAITAVASGLDDV